MENIKGAWYLGGRMGSQEENNDIHKVAKLCDNQEKILKSSSILEIIYDIHFQFYRQLFLFLTFPNVVYQRKKEIKN